MVINFIKTSKLIKYYLMLFFFGIIYIRCQEDHHPATISSTYFYTEPEYSGIQLAQTKDTLHFPLTENTYNNIRSFNYFTQGERSLISFYDRRSESILFYDLFSGKRIKKIDLKKIFPSKRLFKVTVYTRNFDSIFITNNNQLYLFDSSGIIKKSIPFFNRTDAMACLESVTPPILKNDIVYTGVRSYINEEDFSSIHNWRTMYAFDFNKGTRELYYPVPGIYNRNLYGDLFFDYSYCYNDRGHFVFSFPADSCIYETDLKNFHRAYNGKSIFQTHPILPVPRGILSDDKEAYRQYILRDSYGAIYFDPGGKRYLRLVKHKLTESEYAAGKVKKKQSVIVFNERFKIIGEFELTNSFSLGSIFFTRDNQIYARVKSNDEYALHFVRLDYETKLL